MAESKKSSDNLASKLRRRTRSLVSALSSTKAEYVGRRPHRSFRRTRRRDYSRSLLMPGYVAFTVEVASTIRQNKVLFAKLAAVYSILGALFVGVASQTAYTELSQVLDEQDWSTLSGAWLVVTQGSALLTLGLSGSMSTQLTDIQQLYAGLIFLLTWLTTVWVLRALTAGSRPKLRDGLYNAGAPIVSTGMLFFVLLLQMVPGGIALFLFAAASTSELLSNGFISMIAGIATALLCILSLYWAVSTFFALVIVTLPGMYPWRALRSAGDVVIGRRLRILLRICWLLIGNVLAVVVAVIPIVIADRWLKDILPALTNVPVVPFAISVLSSVIVIWSAAYIYLLYRKVVEDDASPA